MAPPSDHAELLSRGNAALARGAWIEAHEAFTQALGSGESPAAHEGLSMVARWVSDEPAVFHHAAAAFRLYRDGGDLPSAARVAMYIADDSVSYRGEPAVANGWLRLARSLLEGLPLNPQHGWIDYYDGYFALMESNNAAVAGDYARRSLAIGRQLGDHTLETLAFALEGLAAVTSGDIREGMPLLDLAAASVMAGDVNGLDLSGSTCCFLLDACCRVRDYDRAAQWVPRMRELFIRNGMELFLSQCRPNYAQVLVWNGDWEGAERELVTGVEEMLAQRPPFAAEAIVRLAELRIRQGRLAEARRNLESVSYDPISQLPFARLALAENHPQVAIDFCERYLRRVNLSARADRATGLELLVPALLAAGQIEDAAARSAELAELASYIGTGAFLGSAAVARGSVAAASGDLSLARASLEDACDILGRAGGAYELARARFALARVLAQLGRSEAAIPEASDAERRFRLFGAIPEADAARELLGTLLQHLPPEPPATVPADGLTPRECEVLQLVGRGLSNQQIAEVLVLSVRTVERHISNIYLKIGAEGPAARTRAATYAAARTTP